MTLASNSELVKLIAQRLSDILEAQVVAFDDRGGVLASARPASQPGPDSSTFHVSVRLNGEDTPLLVRPTHPEEPLSERLVQALAGLLCEQVSTVDRLPNIHQLKNQFVLRFLDGDVDDDDLVLRE